MLSRALAPVGSPIAKCFLVRGQTKWDSEDSSREETKGLCYLSDFGAFVGSILADKTGSLGFECHLFLLGKEPEEQEHA